MRSALAALLLLLLLPLSACASAERLPADSRDTEETRPEETFPEETPPEETGPEEPAPPSDDAGEAEDRVLLTLEAPLADGRTLTLEALGRQVDEYSCGVREVRVYDGETRLQTIAAYEAIEIEWGSAADDLAGQYTNCWDPEHTMEALDLNFDGNTDLGLFGWTPNNTIPYYYWMWDAEEERYQYAFTLQGAEAHPETRELTSEYKAGSAGSQWITRYYRPDENGGLYLDRIERTTLEFQPDSGELDFDRGGALETWVPPEGEAPLRLDPGGGMEAVSARSHGEGGGLEGYLVLVRREIPLYEINADNTVSHFTEIWELRDGEFQMTSREEYFYDDQL